MTSVFNDLFALPLVAAPMAGGPTTTALVQAVAATGAGAFLAAGYKSAAQLERDIADARAVTDRPLGVNVFVPGAPADAGLVDRYRDELTEDAARLGAELGAARWDDDDWHAKLDLLAIAAPALCSFTFGAPSAHEVARLQRAGSVVMVTVTSVAEARLADDRGADLLCAQGVEAGAHRGTFDDGAPDELLSTRALVAALVSQQALPVVAAGGVATPAAVDEVLALGAIAAQVGTALLRCDEAGTNAVHRAALTDERFGDTTLTRAFTGRRARGIVNDFVRRHADAPSAYPEIHHVTRPLRTAAAQAGDADALHLWAGVNYRAARAGPAAAIVDWLVGGR